MGNTTEGKALNQFIIYYLLFTICDLLFVIFDLILKSQAGNRYRQYVSISGFLRG